MKKIEEHFLKDIRKRIAAITGQMPPDMADYKELISIQNALGRFIYTSTEEN